MNDRSIMTAKVFDGYRTIALDFDGVVHAYTSRFTPYPADPPREGAKEFVEKLISIGFRIVYHTARGTNPQYLEHVVNWLMVHGFPEGEVTALKPAAVAYVDDRAVYAGQHTTWKKVLADILALDHEHAAAHERKNR